MSQNDLMLLKVKELETMCKDRGLPCYKGKTHLPKGAMVENILKWDSEHCNVENVVEDVNPVAEENNVVETNAEVPDVEVTNWVNKSKEEYIDNAEPGTLIAFYDLKGKPRTAALVNRSSKRRLVKLVTEFNWEFTVPYENVLWVRRGNRWPKGVYNLLKGYNKNAGDNKEQ